LFSVIDVTALRCNAVTFVTRGILGLLDTSSGAHCTLVISITRGESGDGDGCDLVISITRGESGDGDGCDLVISITRGESGGGNADATSLYL
jgi:hypothetical protein